MILSHMNTQSQQQPHQLERHISARSTTLPNPASVPMSSMKKPELVQALKDLGETPPKEWTVLELHGRLSELRQEKGLPELETKKSRTPLRQMMVDLNKAQRLKADLVKYVSGTLRVPLTGNETVKALMQKGMEAVYQQAPASPQDPIGFGKHASMTYEELWQTQPSYAQWVMDTSWENEGSCPRLHRLANWLEERKKMIDIATPRKAAASSGKVPIEKTKPKGMIEPSKTSSGYVEPSQSSDPETMKILQTLASTVVELKEDMAVLKGEPPRKGQKSTSSEPTEHSFEVMEPMQQ